MKALITATFDEKYIDKLKRLGIEVIYKDWRQTKTNIPENELIKILNKERVDIFITELDNVDEEVIMKTNLKLIGYCRGDPHRHVDLEAATKKKIPVLHTPGRNANAVAELTIGLMLAALRKIVRADRIYRTGTVRIESLADLVDLHHLLRGIELQGKNVGIIGLGKIGLRVAQILRAFGANILVYDPFVNDERVQSVRGKKVRLEELMQDSDIITIHAAVTEESIELIGRKELSLMKSTAFLFNLASPVIVDEDALFEFLKEKKIAGAGLDVFSDEPIDSNNRFLSLDNVVVMPHAGGNTEEVFVNQSRMMTEDIKRFLNGERPLHVLNPEIYD